jgi:excisionase family DNA binding protein
MNATFPGPDNLLTLREACGLLKVSRSTFWKLRAEHNLPTIRVSGLVRIRERDLEAWLDKHTTGGNGEVAGR